MKKEPLVSVIIPSFNAEKYIRRALESVLEQTHKNVEIIVVDDGSTDKTAEIVKSYQNQRIIYIHQENQGQGAARNNGIRIATGEYITFLDADDQYLPEKVKRQVKFLEENPEYKVVYCNALHYFSDNPGNLFKKKYKCPSGDIFPSLLKSSLINPNTIMLHKEICENGIFFDEGEEGRYFDEWSFYLKISRAGYRFGYLNADLVKVEIRKDSHTQWDIQWLMKKKALEFFEKLLSQMDEGEKTLFNTEKILRNLKIKLAIAYLLVKRKKDFSKIIFDLYAMPLAYMIIGILRIFPPEFTKKLLIWVWKQKQKRTFVLVKNLPNEKCLKN